MNWLNKKKYIRYAVWILIIIPGVPLILFTLGYFVFLFWPYDLSSVTQLPLNKQAKRLTLSVHGVKDSSQSWSEPLKQIMNKQSTQKSFQGGPFQDAQHISLDWRPFSDNPLLCSVIAKNIGEKIGLRIVQETDVEMVHAIGHSCGSFMIYGLCLAIKANKPEIKIQTTYLDPVSIYGGLFWNYGVERFGSCADFSDAYIDTGDTVPGSNKALINSYTFDVTQIRIKQKSQQAPHNWPTQYYQQAYKRNLVPRLDKNTLLAEKMKKGHLIPAQDIQ